MSITHRVRRLLVAGVAGAMVLSLMPAGVAAADEHDDVCDDADEFFDGFADADSIADVHIDNVNCMAAFGITIGVDEVPNFAPGANVSRQQMALFIARLGVQALNGNTTIPEAEEGPFTDLDQGVPDAQRNAINFLYSLEITEGVTETTYDPGGDVTREQMASFIARAHDFLGVFDLIDLDEAIEDFDGDQFTDLDDVSEVHLDNVIALQAVGVIRGFESGAFEPGTPVTRQQMSQFIMESVRILDELGLWNGQFVGFVPIDPPDVETPATYTVDLSLAPETPSTATTATFSTELELVEGEGDVEGKLMQFAIFGGVESILDVVNLETGEVDVDAVSFLAETVELGEDGLADFVYPPEVLPVGTHTALAWAADGEEVFNAGDAIGFDFLTFTVVAGEDEPVPPVSPTYELDLTLDPEEPDTASAATFEAALSVDDEDESVASKTVWFTIFQDTSELASATVDEAGEVVDLSAAVVSASAVTDDEGAVAFDFGAGDLPVGEHLAVAWANPDDEPNNAVIEVALAPAVLPFTVVAGLDWDLTIEDPTDPETASTRTFDTTLTASDPEESLASKTVIVAIFANTSEIASATVDEAGVVVALDDAVVSLTSVTTETGEISFVFDADVLDALGGGFPDGTHLAVAWANPEGSEGNTVIAEALAADWVTFTVAAAPA